MRGLGALATALIAVLLLRSTALASLAARGIVIDVLTFATVAWALRRGAGWGATFGFALGLFADLDTAHWLGRHALILSLLGYVVGRLSGTLVQESPRTQFVLLLIATAAHLTWTAAFELGGFHAWQVMVTRVALGSVVTAFLGALVLSIIRRLGGRTILGHADLQSGKTL
ncbi:MAG TPA: rod shape-determining protein MreD [Candidatus Eisenbacteria bacterium]|nr:rod shape-determining protein MreD [Candidatus Eisenbacteria bacterium]